MSTPCGEDERRRLGAGEPSALLGIHTSADLFLVCFHQFNSPCTFFPSCEREDRFAGGSLVTFSSILVRLQAKREGGDYVLPSFNKFMLCMILAGCAGGTVLPAAL